VVELVAAWTLERGLADAALGMVVRLGGGGEAVLDEGLSDCWLLDFRLLPPRKLRRDMLLEKYLDGRGKRITRFRGEMWVYVREKERRGGV
jgi:hypothetical protein